jgi:hypothetical protein
VLKEPKRVELTSEATALAILEAVDADHIPRLVERDGRPIAVVLAPEDYEDTVPIPKSRRFKAELMALAGAWKDIDADAMIEYIYRGRHESPPSPPVES